MVTREHVTAVLALVDSVPNVTVYDGTVPDHPSLPYVVVRTDSGTWTRTALTAASDQITMDVYATSVGESRDQAQWVSEKVMSALLDVRPTIVGRTCAPIESIQSQPVQRDDDVSPPLCYVVDVLRLASVRA